MGNGESRLPPPPDGLSHAVLAIRKRDRLRLLHFGERDLQLMNRVFDEFLEGGVKKVLSQSPVYELRFDGQPFVTTDRPIKSTTAQLLNMCCHLLVEMHLAGWRYVTASSMTNVRELSAVTWHVNTAQLTKLSTTSDFMRARADHYTIGVHFSSPNVLLLVNASRHTQQSIVDHLQTSVDVEDEDGLQIELQTLSNGDCALTMPGTPWKAGNDLKQTIAARKILLEIFRYFDHHQMLSYASININGPSDTIFFQKDRYFAPGLTQYTAICIHSPDRLFFVDTPQPLRDVCRKTILSQWKLGVHRTTAHKSTGVFEVHLNGSPWSSDADDGIRARLTIVGILQTCHARGWKVQCAFNGYRDSIERTTFILRSDSTDKVPIRHICLCPLDSSRLSLLDAPSNVVHRLAHVLKTHWPKGIARKGPSLRGQEWRLHGQPWDASNETNSDMQVQHLVTCIIHELLIKGWHLICTFDAPCKYRGKEPQDVQCLVFAELNRLESETSSIGGRQRSSIGRSHSSAPRKRSNLCNTRLSAVPSTSSSMARSKSINDAVSRLSPSPMLGSLLGSDVKMGRKDSKMGRKDSKMGKRSVTANGELRSPMKTKQSNGRRKPKSVTVSPKRGGMIVNKK